MKVVQVLPALDGGGVERGTLEIARALVAAGHESIVLSAGGRLVGELECDGSRHMTWPLGSKHPLVALEVPRLRSWLAAERPSILHARSRLPAWICYLAWRRMAPRRRPRFVTTLHGLHSVSAYSAVMARGERVIAVSDTARRYLLDNYGRGRWNRPGICPERIERIYRGIDPARYRRDYRPAAEWRERWRSRFPHLVDRPLVVLPGRLTRLKGHEDLPDILAEVRTRHGDVAGVVVGGESAGHRAYADSVRARSPEITFTGHRSDLREIMASAAVVLSLSGRPESFGRTVLEALSLGVPVAGYDHGGVGEILGQVFPEGRVPVGDAAAAAERVSGFLERPEAARSRIRDHDFTLARMCGETLSLYASMASS